MQLVRRLRIPAFLCAVAVLLCELLSRPYANMGVADDWPYILSAQTLAATSHIVYNGWAAPILGWQLYAGAAFIKLFGFSFTIVRSSTLLVSMTMAFVLQRILIRTGISEYNATLGTLALVLSPLYLMLSVTFMTDIFGLFAIVLCLYGCLRALATATTRATILWLCFAIALNALGGTARQIAWLGTLVMVPSTLWLLRVQRRVLLAGIAANLLGVLFIFACIHWFSRQPFTLPEHLFVASSYPASHTVAAILYFFLDLPFLLVPLVALFLPQIRNSHSRILALLAAVTAGYLLLAFLWRHPHPNLVLEPTLRDWVGVYGIFEGGNLQGIPPVFLGTLVRILLTIASLGGLLGLLASFLSSRRTQPAISSPSLTWKQLATLLLPFSLAYTLLLIPRASSSVIYDRYALSLLVIALIYLVRYYQQAIHPRLPLASILLIGAIATYGIAVTHNLFSLYRARVDLAAELRANGIPDTSVDNGWEYNIGVELRHANHINEPTIVVPADAYVPQPPLPYGTCPTHSPELTPHILPLYGISFDPNACYGIAPFVPMHYTRWLASSPGTLYVVRYTPPLKP